MASNILQRGKKRVDITLVMQLVEDNDIIDICIMMNDKKIHIGTNADSNSRGGPTFDKLYYIEKENFEDIQEFRKHLINLNNNNKSLSVLSVDDIPASKMEWANDNGYLFFNNKGKSSLKTICTNFLLKWSIIIFGTILPLPLLMFFTTDTNSSDLIWLLILVFILCVIFSIFCIYIYKFALCVKEQEKKYSVKFVVDKYKWISDCYITEDWFIAVGRFALYKKDILSITKSSKVNSDGNNKIIIKTDAKTYKVTIDEQSGINYLLKWIKNEVV